MEINKIRNVDVYNNQKALLSKNQTVGKDSDTREDGGLKMVKPEKIEERPKQKNEQLEVKYNGAIAISYALEKDLDMVVANVIDSKTKEKVRQVPPEEIVRNKKLLKTYQESLSSRGKLVDDTAK